MTTRIEKTAIIEPGAFIGENCYIGHFAVIRPRTVIGDYSEIRAHCFIAADVMIGSNTNIHQFSDVCRDTIIEDYVFVGARTTFTNTKKIAYKRDYNDFSEPVYVEYGARIGAGCTLCPGIRIGRNSYIGAGSLVTKDTLPEYLYYGNPAKLIRKVSQEEILKTKKLK